MWAVDDALVNGQTGKRQVRIVLCRKLKSNTIIMSGGEILIEFNYIVDCNV